MSTQLWKVASDINDTHAPHNVYEEFYLEGPEINLEPTDRLREPGPLTAIAGALNGYAALTAEVAQLREDKAELVRQHNEMIDLWHKERDGNEKELAQLRESYDKLYDEDQEVRVKLNTVSNDIETIRRDRDIISNDFFRVRDELAQVKAERDELMKETERLSDLKVDEDAFAYRGKVRELTAEMHKLSVDASNLRATVTSQAATIEALKAELEAERKIVNPLFSLEIGDGSWVTTDSIAIIEKSKELGLFGHVSESKNPFSCGGVPLQRVHFSK